MTRASRRRTAVLASLVAALALSVVPVTTAPRLVALRSSLVVAEANAAPNDGADKGGADKVVARVGEMTITQRELEQRLSEIPRSKLSTLGSSPEEIKKNFLEQIVVPDMLLAEEGRARGLDKLRDIRDKELGVLRAILVDDLKAEAKTDEIGDEDVRRYYAANPDRFMSPKRIAIQRILVATEEEARLIIADVGDTPDPKKWNDVARSKSLDKANNIRGGNLGFVAEDGSTGQAETKVDPALYYAADAVKDGAIVPNPVKEGPRFAVVWKRQTTKPVARSLEGETPAIRASIADERIRTSVQTLLEKLREEQVKELNNELCDIVTITAQGDIERAKRPGTLPRSKRQASPAPVEGPGGLR